MPELSPTTESELLSPLEKLEQKLNLRQQYDSQFRILAESRILKLLPETARNLESNRKPVGFVDINNNECPVPSYEEIKAGFSQTPEQLQMIEQRVEQGFTKLLLVPFGMAIGGRKSNEETGSFEYQGLAGKYAELLRRLAREDKLVDTEGGKLSFDEREPLWIDGQFEDADVKGNMLYDVDSYNQNQTEPEKHTKTKIISQSGSWQILLVEDLPEIPPEGTAKVTQDNKPALVPGQSPEEYLEILKKHGLKGLTFESWLALAITYLLEGKGQIDNYQGKGKISWLLNNFLPSSGRVPFGFWGVTTGGPALGADHSSNRLPRCCARSSVEPKLGI